MPSRSTSARLPMLWLVLASAAGAHDLSLDVSGTFTRSSATNPRVGSVSTGLSGSYDVNDQWSLMGTVLYTRDLGTKSASSSSSGSNVSLFNAGVMWLPSESVMTSLSLSGSPPTEQQNATTVTVGPRTTDVLINSRTFNFGALWNGLWASSGTSGFEHTVDVTLGANLYGVRQQMVVPETPVGRLVEQSCLNGSTFAVCDLVRGSTTTLWQGRLGAGYTATLFKDTDVGLDGAYYLYSVPPSNVGYFSLVLLGRAELGSGVPVQPLQFTLKPSVVHRFGPVTLKVAYQFGLYTESLGALHAFTLKASWKVTTHWRLSLSLIGQGDSTPQGAANTGGQALFGVLYLW